MRYTAKQLEKLPTISQGHFDNLKVETPTKRVWLCRCGIADGMPYDDMVTVEHYFNNRWTIVQQYPG